MKPSSSLRSAAGSKTSPAPWAPFAALRLAALGLLPLATLAGCGRAAVGRLDPGAGDTVYVGVAVGLQSPERYANVFRGVEMALEELNAARPAGAPPLALRRAPDSASSAVEIAAAFRDDPRVVGVVGHTESAATIAAAAVYGDRAHGGRDALVAVSPTASASLVTRVNAWVFRVCPVATAQARALARYAADSLRLARVAVLYRNDPSGKDFLRAFADELESRGGRVVERDPFMEEIPEFDGYARRMAGRGVRGVVISGNASDARKAIRAVRRAGGTPVFLASNPPEGADAEARRDFAGLRFVTLYAPDRPATPAGARFAADFARRAGLPPDHWAALGYDAATLIGRAVQAVGPQRRAVRDWIAGVGTASPPLDGASGVIRFDGGGDPVEKTVIVREATR